MFRGGLVSWCFEPIQPHRANWGQVLCESSITDLVGWVLLYIHRNCRLIRDGGPGWLPRLSHSSWALTVTGGMFGFLYLLDAVVIIMMMIVIHYYFLVATKRMFCCDKCMLVGTKLLSQQNYVCRDKNILSYICHNKRCVRNDQSFFATKMVLMAAPANDSELLQPCQHGHAASCL